MAEVHLNTAAASHASSLIASGDISSDKSWSPPSAEASTAYLEKNGPSEFGKFYLGIRSDVSDEKSKSHFAYPYSADLKSASLRGLRAIISRATQAGAKAIEEKAQSLYDSAKAKLGKGDKERSVSAITKICLRKASERMARNEVFVPAATAAGYTANDLMRWLQEELCEVPFPSSSEGEEPCCCYSAWPVNIVLPEHEKNEVWQVIVQARGCLYAVDFKLGEAGVEIVGEPKEVKNKDSYVLMDAITEEASDEAAGRSADDRAQRKIPNGKMHRVFEISPAEADEANLTIPVSFSSELPGLQRCGDSSRSGEPTACERSAGLKSGDVYIEILDHDPDNMDHSILNNSGAVLDEHDEKDQIGVVTKGSAHTDKSTRVGRATLKLDDGEKGRMRFRQMKSGIRPHLSAGYKHTKHLGKESLPDGRTAHRFAWQGMEISSVAVPLDGTIGVGRSYKELPQVDSDYKNKSSETTTETKEKSMTEAETKAAQDAAHAAAIKAAEDKVRADTEAKVRADLEGKINSASTTSAAASTTSERTRFKEISAIANGLIEKRKDQEKAIRELADKCLADGTEVNAFKIRAMEDILNAKPAIKNSMEAMGYDEEERGRFSLKRAIQNIIKQADGGKQGVKAPDPDTFEGEVCAKMRKAYDDSGTPCIGGGTSRGNGFLVPHDANLTRRSVSRKDIQKMQRDATMQATIFGQGGAAVATELLLPIVEILRNEMVTDKLGVTSIAGLEGNIVIPRQAAAATAYAVAETTALTLSGQILDQIPLAPKRVGAWANYTKQFLLQSSLDVENFIRTDLFAVIALAWDNYIIAGQGGASQPTGILNTNGVLLVNGTGAFTGYAGDVNAPSWADIVNFETQIAKVNARRQGRAWATTSNSKGRLKTLAKLLVGATTVASVPLWEEGGPEAMLGSMNGYPAIDSQQVPSDLLIFGVWPMNVIHALWGGLDIVVDPYSLSTQGEVKIVMNTWGDVALRHPQEFCVSLNAASA